MSDELMTFETSETGGRFITLELTAPSGWMYADKFPIMLEISDADSSQMSAHLTREEAQRIIDWLTTALATPEPYA